MHYFIIFFETCDEASLLFSKFNLLSATTFRAFSSEKKTINNISIKKSTIIKSYNLRTFLGISRMQTDLSIFKADYL